jgi:hypothetical protein
VLLGRVLSLARVWRHREQVEREAAAQFAQLADDLRASAVPAHLVALAQSAAEDEAAHAILCRCLVDHIGAGHPPLPPLPPRPVVVLGPPGLSVNRRALYASVALSCVTETFSTALLLEMQRLATDDRVAQTVHRILRDEVQHSRLGWAHLAWAAERGDVSWLGPYLGDMVNASVGSDLPLELLRDESGHPGDGSGVLSAARIQDVVTAALEQVVVPGFARYGLDTSSLDTRALFRTRVRPIRASG